MNIKLSFANVSYVFLPDYAPDDDQGAMYLDEVHVSKSVDNKQSGLLSMTPEAARRMYRALVKRNFTRN